MCIGVGPCSIITPLNFLPASRGLAKPMMVDVNAVSREIKDMQGRLEALRGYL
jgi:hypothetical protein